MSTFAKYIFINKQDFMLIFNTTYLVSDKVQDAWLLWVREQHIPFMLQFKPFSHPQVARVIPVEEQDGTSYSVQFHVLDLETLGIWKERFGLAFQQNCAHEFGTEAIYFSTVLDIIE